MIYKDGVVVDQGKIIIKDDTNTTIIDATGLVSTANFVIKEVEQSADNFPINSWEDVTGATMTFTLSRTTNLLFLYSASMGYSSGATGYAQMYVRLNIGEVTTYRPWLVKDIEASVWDMNELVSSFSLISLNAGTHTAKLETEVDTASITGFVTGVKLTRLNLGV